MLCNYSGTCIRRDIINTLCPRIAELGSIRTLSRLLTVFITPIILNIFDFSNPISIFKTYLQNPRSSWRGEDPTVLKVQLSLELASQVHETNKYFLFHRILPLDG